MKTLVLVCAALAGLAVAQALGEGVKKSALKRAFFKDVPVGRKASVDEGVKIYNGSVAAPGQFPYYVGIYVDMQSFCGGSLINPKWVLTAAHCVDGGSFWTLFLGVTSMQLPKEAGREVHVTRGGVAHPLYDADILTNDVGLIQLMQNVRLNSRIDVVRLTPPGMMYAVGTLPTVAGFGLVSDDSPRVISDKLMYTKMPIANSDLCYDRYGSADVSQICIDTKQVGSSSCAGDSGGPLVIKGDATQKDVLIGATSFGPSDGCTLGLPVGFSNLTVFIGWIEKTTGIHYPFDTNES